MITSSGILGYCSNIHPGENWKEHFEELKNNLPKVKAQVCPKQAFGFGLRIAYQASIDLLSVPAYIDELKNWLNTENLFVFTLNGFPFGGFHHSKVKDEVHRPDWTTKDRLEYTKRLAEILVQILPETLETAGISTSPLSYKFWWNKNEMPEVFRISTNHIVELALFLNTLKKKTGKSIHLDIEPEPDGLLGNHREFMDWYEHVLLQNHPEYTDILKEHIQICFDVCHYAISYDPIEETLDELKSKGIGVGKIQISSALKVDLSKHFEEQMDTLKQYKEPIYLHQVRALNRSNEIIEYSDLDEAFEHINDQIKEARVHFHVPIFIENYENIGSTQSEIVKSLTYQKLNSITKQLEIETYTWGVLPSEFQKPIEESVAREVQWVLDHIQ
jgi:hypothetical protein